MDARLSADELFDMAEEIERSGARSYKEASQKATIKKMKLMLLDLAAMEDGHLQIFQQMRMEFRDSEQDAGAFGSDEGVSSYIQVVVESAVSEDTESPLAKLTGEEQMREVLHMAIEEEKRSILFYAGLQKLAQIKADKDKLEAIIKEEMSHIVSLNLSLAMLRPM